MKWRGNRASTNVEDRRGGGFGGLGGRSVGLGTIVLAFLGSWLFGIDPSMIINLLSGGQAALSPPAAHAPPADDQASQFVSVVLADTEDVWKDQFQALGQRYVEPSLVLFSGRTGTACGLGQSAAGPFYCPGDQKVYIDLSFYQLMQERFNVSGDFAQAYVIAHEVGHHVQNLLGYTEKAYQARVNGASERDANALSVRLELQADCLAGLWANHANRARAILEAGDVETALNAASAIGDDALQRQTQGEVVPDSFTHGSSEQRVRWFRRGLENGRLEDCDTFRAAGL